MGHLIEGGLMPYAFKAAILWTNPLVVTPFIFPRAMFFRIREYGTSEC